jgi:MFS family permease
VIRAAALALAVGLVLADSSVVILALPSLLTRFHVEIGSLQWVITAFNAALAVTAVPAARLARGSRARPVAVAGLLVFAAASLACAAAPSYGVLVAARTVQAVGGAATVCAALALLVGLLGSEQRAVRLWVLAGVAGAAVGPALGGALTQAFSWRAIFVMQAPIALVAAAGALAVRVPAVAESRTDRPDWPVHASLALVSAALTAALFLLVLLLTEAWGLSPLGAAVTVSVMAASAVVASALRPASDEAAVTAGVVALAAGLAALGLVPGASLWWTIAPQALIGLGLGLAIGVLSDGALRGREPLPLHGGYTIASRHLGVVLGLLLLTPLFTSDLGRQADAATQSGTALLLDAQLPTSFKFSLAGRIVSQIDHAGNGIPDLAPAFAAQPAPAGGAAEYARLRRRLNEQVQRAATHAFSRAFWVAAALGLLALVPPAVARRRRA